MGKSCLREMESVISVWKSHNGNLQICLVCRVLGVGYCTILLLGGGGEVAQMIRRSVNTQHGNMFCQPSERSPLLEMPWLNRFDYRRSGRRLWQKHTPFDPPRRRCEFSQMKYEIKYERKLNVEEKLNEPAKVVSSSGVVDQRFNVR